jgi:hypothetical protein
LRKDGKVLETRSSDHIDGVSAWENVAAIAAGASHVVGLQKYS